MPEANQDGAALAASSFTVRCAPSFLTARFSSPQRALSWSLLHPGFAIIRDVVWVEVRNRDLGPGVDPRALLRRTLVDGGFPDALALMTSRDIRHWRLRTSSVEGVEAACLTTVGLSNGERVGARRPVRALAGTINTLVHVSRPLTDGAMVEAISIVAEARTAAILESRRTQDGPAITGTGTDCIVVAAPPNGEPEPWAASTRRWGKRSGRRLTAPRGKARRNGTPRTRALMSESAIVARWRGAPSCSDASSNGWERGHATDNAQTCWPRRKIAPCFVELFEGGGWAPCSPATGP
jgi:adenosylcobinamide amidohydrolase